MARFEARLGVFLTGGVEPALSGVTIRVGVAGDAAAAGGVTELVTVETDDKGAYRCGTHTHPRVTHTHSDSHKESHTHTHESHGRARAHTHTHTHTHTHSQSPAQTYRVPFQSRTHTHTHTRTYSHTRRTLVPCNSCCLGGV